MYGSIYLHTAPSAAPSVTTYDLSSTAITVQWGPVDCIHRNGNITGYSIQYGNETVSISGNSSGGMYIISGLEPSTTYSIQVAASTSAGLGPYTTPIDQLTSGDLNYCNCNCVCINDFSSYSSCKTSLVRY